MANATQPDIGTVASLWRYPVKSMMGEELNASEVTERGLLGDRVYALVDSSDEKIATAKNPKNCRISSTSGRALSSLHASAPKCLPCKSPCRMGP